MTTDPVPPPIHWFERVASTQDLAHQLAGDGAPDGTTVVAVEQTAGRGSRGREWTSPRGGLWLSVVLRPGAVRPTEALSLRAAVAAASELERLGVAGVRIKWPNDLMLDGRKLGGILCEARWSGDVLGWIVVGLGLNVENTIPAPLATVATSLHGAGYAHSAGDLAAPVAAALRAAGSAAGPLAPAEQEAFARRDWLNGRTLESPVPGVAIGVDPDGALRVRGGDGTVRTARVGPVIISGDRERLTTHS